MRDGKRFEQDFKQSAGNSIYYQRIYDQAAGFGQNENTRFSLKNPFDCILYQYPLLMLLELKTFKGRSFAANKVKDHQAASLLLASNHKGVVPGYVLNFRDQEQTVFLYIRDFVKAFQMIDKKSINFSDCLFFGGIQVEQFKKRVRYTYNLQKLLTDCKQKYL